MDPSTEHPRPGAEAEPAPDAPDAAAADAAADATAASRMTTAHLARFEFSEHGTKILMVEWHPAAIAAAGDPVTGAAAAVKPPHAPETLPTSEPASKPVPDSDADADDAAAWHISWPGKNTFLPASESDRDQDGARCRRVYFLLPPDASIPGTVTITGPGLPSLELKPLPAIFPDGFDFEAGPRGVLHTIWAKKRLSELDREMDAELRTNAESVGLEMARAERQWIVDNFLPPPPTPKSDVFGRPLSPRSPGPSRLGDKLKGLRLATSPADLAPSPTANTFTAAGAQSLTLSPTGGDVAVSSFPALSRTGNAAAPISLNAALHGDVGATAPASDSQDAEDDLFALPISPRSPDMKRSPFSIL